jgi:hypothetical protein
MSPDRSIGGLAYAFCLLSEDMTIDQTRILVLEQSDDRLPQEEWLHLRNLSYEYVCPEALDE